MYSDESCLLFRDIKRDPAGRTLIHERRGSASHFDQDIGSDTYGPVRNIIDGTICLDAHVILISPPTAQNPGFSTVAMSCIYFHVSLLFTCHAMIRDNSITESSAMICQLSLGNRDECHQARKNVRCDA